MRLTDQEREVLKRFREVRAAMGRIRFSAERWCETFDAGDADATQQYHELLVEALLDYSRAIDAVKAAAGEQPKSSKQPPRPF